MQTFKKDKLLYFDTKTRIFIITDARVTGLGTILAQGCNLNLLKPVAIVSRTTSTTERRYPQLELEATAIDFALRQFWNYLAGAKEVKIK